MSTSSTASQEERKVNMLFRPSETRGGGDHGWLKVSIYSCATGHCIWGICTARSPGEDYQ